MPAIQKTPQLTVYRNGQANLNGEATRALPRGTASLLIGIGDPAQADGAQPGQAWAPPGYFGQRQRLDGHPLPGPGSTLAEALPAHPVLLAGALHTHFLGGLEVGNGRWKDFFGNGMPQRRFACLLLNLPLATSLTTANLKARL